MKRFIFILGGARSGKSGYAVELAKKIKKKTAFVATLTSPDGEMKKRIKLHKASRPREWKLIEEGGDISPVLSKLEDKYEVILIDCLGLLITNLLAGELTDKEIEKRIKKLINTISRMNLTAILVSNEVGSGIVPENPLARRFRDLVGLANQMMTKKADEVIFMQAGIPIEMRNEKCKIKNGGRNAEIK